MAVRPLKVMKFGGSSVATPDRIRTVARIVQREAQTHRVAVVVSAFGGVTNQLLECASLAERAGPGAGGGRRLYDEIAERHRAACAALIKGPRRRAVLDGVNGSLASLSEILHGILLLRHASPRALDLVAGYGEMLSAAIVAEYLNRFVPAIYGHAGDFVVTDDQFTKANVIFDKTNRALRAWYRKHVRGRRPPIPVITGFIGATVDGQRTTIGRNGSDYSAAIVGGALDADVIEIWTDVDGVLSADPRAVPSAFVLPRMTYEEAMELSYFGATVLHASTMAPAVAKGIPIHIKNTLNPRAPGTVIARTGDDAYATKGITAVDGVTLLTLRGLSMVGVPGTAERLFRALAARRVNVILISQASSEHTICFAVIRAEALAATAAVRDEFRFELQHGLTTLDQKPDQTVLAVVGEGMKGRPGVSGDVFGSLGRHGINISAIAQGASERNISLVIDAPQRVRALNVIHQAFFERKKRLALVVVGVGNIGSALLEQLQQQRAYLSARGFDVRVVAAADSRRFVLKGDGLDLTTWQADLARSRKAMSPASLIRALKPLELTDAALVDCTASESLVDAYPEFIEAGLHVITPNKRANVLPWARYAALQDQLRRRQKFFLCEANVGAGLPVMSTLNDLVASGDTVRSVEGILSGTLSFLFNSYDGSRPFSEIVREAHGLGFTEPDPRADLSGEDVARKLLILGRHMGLEMDLADVQVESLVPNALARGAFSDRFFVALAKADAAMHRRWSAAHARGKVLRYAGRVSRGPARSRRSEARAGLAEYPADHPFASAKRADNVIAFTTDRYAATPLVVQGPGAGAAVTAMGVFSDILKLLNALPH